MDTKVLTNHRLNRLNDLSLQSIGEDPPPIKTRNMKDNVVLDCGWGNLIFGQTFQQHKDIINFLAREKKGKRNIAIYVHNHHVLLSKAPELLFVDPSDTLRLWLYNYRMPKTRSRIIRVRLLKDEHDAREINRIYKACEMIESPTDTIVKNQKTQAFCYFLAERVNDNKIIGTIMGVDHKKAFNDPDNGSSLWCLAVDPEVQARGTGKMLVRAVAEHYLAKGRDFLDLSVLYDNEKALRLYKSLGFSPVPVYAVKKKNEINENFYRGGPKP